MMEWKNFGWTPEQPAYNHMLRKKWNKTSKRKKGCPRSLFLFNILESKLPTIVQQTITKNVSGENSKT